MRSKAEKIMNSSWVSERRFPPGPGLGALASAGELLHRRLYGQLLPLAGGAALQLDHAVLQAARPDHQVPRQADQVHAGKLDAGTLVRVVVQHLDAARRQVGIELFADPVAVGIAGLEV